VPGRYALPQTRFAHHDALWKKELLALDEQAPAALLM